MAIADLLLDPVLARGLAHVGEDRGPVGDRLLRRPRFEAVAERVHVGVRADPRVAEEVPGAAEVLARLEDRVAAARAALLQVPGGADPREAGADDQHVEMFGRPRGHGGILADWLEILDLTRRSRSGDARRAAAPVCRRPPLLRGLRLDGRRADDELEADDLLGTYARLEAEAGGRAMLLTGDRDMYQCAGRAGHRALRDAPAARQRRRRGRPRGGARALRRRPGAGPRLHRPARRPGSDGLPGAKGVGPKTAADLLREHGTLEATLDDAIRERRPKLRAALIDGRDDLLAFKDIATLRDAGVDAPAGPPDRLGRRRRGRPRARHEPPRRAARAERRVALPTFSTPGCGKSRIRG